MRRVCFSLLFILSLVGVAFATSHAVFNGSTASQQPNITSQPSNFTVIAGSMKTLTATAIGAAPITFQWFKNNVAVTAPSSSGSYTTPALLQSDTGAVYVVKAVNSFGTATSLPITATVNTDIVINVQPQTQTVTSPSQAMFTVAATGAATLSCQWYKNGVLISGATSCTSYTTPATAVTDSGSAFTVIFTDIYSQLSSMPATLTVMPPTAISFISNAFNANNGTPPQSCVVNVPAGTQINDLEILYFATGTTTPTIPSGWTLINNVVNSVYTSYAYYHVYGSGEPASYTFGNLFFPECTISSYRGATISGSPVDASAICTVPSATTSCTIPALAATTGNNEIYIACFDYNTAAAGSPNQINGPGSMTKRFSDGTALSMWCGDQAFNAQGTIPPAQTATGTDGSQIWDAIGFTLKSGTGTTSNFTVTTPTINQTVSGIITAQGTAGSQWVNVAAYYNGTKISLADITPSGGNWSLQIDTTKIPNAPSTCPGSTSSCPGNPSTCPSITITAFSVPSGQSGGTSVSINVDVNVQNSNSSIFTVSAPTSGTIVSGSAAPANGTCGSQWTAIQAFFNSTAVSSPTTCVNGAWSLVFNTTTIPNGTAQVVVFQASASGFTPASISVSLNVSNGTTGTNGLDAFGLPNTPTFPNVAVPAYAFLQSIGFNIWPPNDGSAANLLSMVTSLGLRWVRGTVGPTSNSTLHSQYVNLANSVNSANPTWNFKLDYITNGQNGAGCPTTINCYTTAGLGSGNSPAAGTEVANFVALNNAGLLKFIESDNEIDNEQLQWNGVVYGCNGGCSTQFGSFNGNAQYQATLYAAVRSNSSLNNVAVSTQTYVGGAYDNSGLQYGLAMPTPLPSGLSSGSPGPQAAGTKWADVLAVHPYLATNGPPVFNNIQDGATHDAYGNGHEPYVQDFKLTWKGGFTGMTQAQLNTTPGVSTESGVPDNTGGQDYQGQVALDQYIEGFTGCNPTGGTAACIQGSKISSVYSLVDNDGGFPNVEGAFTASFSPKLEAIWVGNMTTILNDTGASFTPGTVNWTISGCPTGGNGNVNTCHGLLLQKSNGHFWLLQTYDWNGGTNTTVTINFGTTFGHVNVYDPTVSTSVQSALTSVSSYTYTNNNGHPKFLELF